MSELSDRTQGIVDETVGKAKRALGDALNNADLKAEGDAQEAKGDMEKVKAKAEKAIS